MTKLYGRLQRLVDVGIKGSFPSLIKRGLKKRFKGYNLISSKVEIRFISEFDLRP